MAEQGRTTKLDSGPGGGVPWRLLLLILLAAVCVRLARGLISDPVTKDSVLYVEMAEDWAAAGVKNAFDRNPRIPPLYIGLMAAGERLGLGAEVTGLLVAVLAGMLLPLAVFFLSRGLFMEMRPALLAAALAAAHPMLLRNSAEVMRDSLFLACFVSALALAAAGMTSLRWRAWCWWGLAGLAAALAALTRDEGGELLLIIAVWGAVEAWRGDGNFLPRLRRVAAGGAVFVLVYAMVLLPVWKGLAGTTSEWHPAPERLLKYGRAFGMLPPSPNSGEPRP
jgi:hypothetical protein